MFKSLVAAALAGMLAFACSAFAQHYPTRPVTMVVPFAAGGPTDVPGRAVPARMSELLFCQNRFA
jgi:tripartite-type tricarboxylate transporter receptor subunit TctC